MKDKKIKLVIYGLIKVCPSRRHAWYDTNLGFPVRKPLGKVVSFNRKEIDNESGCNS